MSRRYRKSSDIEDILIRSSARVFVFVLLALIGSCFFRKPEGMNVVAISKHGEDFVITEYFCDDVRLGFIRCTSGSTEQLAVPEGFKVVAAAKKNYAKRRFFCEDITTHQAYACTVGDDASIGDPILLPQGHRLVGAAVKTYRSNPRLICNHRDRYCDCTDPADLKELDIPRG